MDNFQMSMAWQCYWPGALPVQGKLYRHGYTVRRDCPNCSLSDEAALLAPARCSGTADLWGYVEQFGVACNTDPSVVPVHYDNCSTSLF